SSTTAAAAATTCAAAGWWTPCSITSEKSDHERRTGAPQREGALPDRPGAAQGAPGGARLPAGGAVRAARRGIPLGLRDPQRLHHFDSDARRSHLADGETAVRAGADAGGGGGPERGRAGGANRAMPVPGEQGGADPRHRPGGGGAARRRAAVRPERAA